MIDTAVILAAGSGKRLKALANNMPKGFIVLGDMPIIEESIRKLIGAGIEKIIIGTGFASEYYEELESKYSQIRCVKNNDYSDSGSMYTLYIMRKFVGGDFLLLESDIIYDKSGLYEIISDGNRNVILASGSTDSGDEVYIEADEDHNLVNLSKNIWELKSAYAELVGITKLSYGAYVKMCGAAELRFKSSKNVEYESILKEISLDEKIFIRRIEDYKWAEIDDESHLKRAVNNIYPGINKHEKS
ncbi:MAG: phosphocholine cytidylyltransferase family protein [Victivallales bacterium]|jgi:2-aminoethylphosphonate-pyruvate transaminase